jgi:nucleotide-binding universal stress UspA family protein
MYNTILVLLDGSKRAEAILCYVKDLALRYDATVILLQVIEPQAFRIDPERDHTTLREQLERRKKHVQSYLAALQQVFREKGVKAHTRIVQGSAVEAIINTAEREDADLIAIAGQDRAGWSEGFYGCVAAGALHCVDWPVLLIRSQESPDEKSTMEELAKQA